jgi:hypothetical protein
MTDRRALLYKKNEVERWLGQPIGSITQLPFAADGVQRTGMKTKVLMQKSSEHNGGCYGVYDTRLRFNDTARLPPKTG